mgnify:CR=1 FL=1
MTTVKNEQQFAKLIFVIGGLKMNLVRVKNNDIKVIERHPVKVLGNDYRVKIVYKNVKIAMLDVEDDTIKLTLQNKYKKMNNTQMLDLAIEKMYESIAKVEIERAMEKTRIMLGFAPEDYKIEKLKNENKGNILGQYIESLSGYPADSLEYQALCEGVQALMETRRG